MWKTRPYTLDSVRFPLLGTSPVIVHTWYGYPFILYSGVVIPL